MILILHCVQVSAKLYGSSRELDGGDVTVSLFMKNLLNGGGSMNLKHCQRHNGPEGFSTSSYTNLDQI